MQDCVWSVLYKTEVVIHITGIVFLGCFDMVTAFEEK
jgi:hypothetical protein